MIVGVVCHDLLFREALESLLRASADNEVLTLAGDIRTAIGQLARLSPDIVLIVEDGLTEEEWVMFAALRTLTGVRSVVLTRSDLGAPRPDLPADALVRRSDGAAVMLQTMREVSRRAFTASGTFVAERVRTYGIGERRLTARETEVARLIAQGLPNRRIGIAMGLREQSVKNLVSVVMRKLDCENRVQVALKLSGSLGTQPLPVAVTDPS